MGKHEKLRDRILASTRHVDFHFDEVRTMLKHFGFSERISSSHHIFWRADIKEIIDLLPKGGKAKPYQLRQVRDILEKYRI